MGARDNYAGSNLNNEVTVDGEYAGFVAPEAPCTDPTGIYINRRARVENWSGAEISLSWAGLAWSRWRGITVWYM